MVDFIKKTDPALYSKIEKEVSESNVKRRVTKDGRRLKGSYMEWVKAQPTYANLSKEAQIEEAFAEMMGDAAYGHFVNRQSTLGRLRELMKEILKKITPLKFDNPESVSLDDLSLTDIRKNLAGALVDGRTITVGGVEFEVGDIQADKEKVNDEIRAQVNEMEPNNDLDVVDIDISDDVQTQEIKFQAPEYYPNFDVSKVNRGSIKEFNGQKATLLTMDRSASGVVVSPTGVKHEFDGGVFYPYQEGTGVWAFSTTQAASKLINKAKESDGLVFLTAMAPGSIDGSVNMFDYVMKELDQAIKDKRVSKKEVVDFLNKKMTMKSFDSKARSEGIKTKKIKSVKEFRDLVLSLPTAFGVRKDIISKSIRGKALPKWGIPSYNEMYDFVNQDIIKDLKGNPIVAAIRIDTEAGYIDSRTDDSIKDHPTYPIVVKGEPLMIFDKTVDASDIWDELNLADKFLIDSKTGEPLSEGSTQARRQQKILMAQPVIDLKFQEATEEEVISNFLSEQKYFQSTNPHAWAVDEVKEETLKISQIREFKGTFGVVAPNGDIKGVFNPGKTGERGTLKGLMPLLIKAGGSKLDNFDGALTGMYENLGFRVVARTPFNEEYAPPGWIKELHGTPDVVAMIYDPNAEVVFEEKFFPDPETGYGEMIEYRDSHVRYQIPDDEGTHNVYKSGLATIAWDISKAIIDSDYKAGRYLTKYIDKKQQYDIRLTTLLAKPFGTHSNKEVKEIMVRSKGNLNVELLRVSEASNKLKKAMKGSNLSRSEVNDLLHNLNEVKSMEASALKEALIEMRTHIDYLSKTLVSEGLVKGQTQFTIDSNLGVYVTRSYKQFDVKGWTQTDNDIIKNAKDFLYREAKKDNPEATEERLQEIVGVAYRKLTEDKEFFRSSNGATNLDGLTRVNSIFKEKKIIPEEIRDLWGEIDNPLYNYSNTISKVARTISAERMYKDLNEIGQGKFISDTQTPETYNELVGSKWGSLEGKFVDEEMFAVMNQTVKNLEGNLWYDSYMRLVLFNKKMKTVWNPGTHAKNVIGNTSFAIMNGHIGFNGGMYKDAKTAIKAVQSLKSPELKALYSKLVALGVVNSSASLQEIRGIAEDINDTKFDLSEYLDEKSGKIQKLMAKAARATGKPIKYLDKKAMQAYQAEDDVWKIFGYLSEKARYVKAGMDAKAAEELAAKNIRNLYPNYNEIPRIIRYLGRSPIVGSFVAFQAESIRNAKNTVLLGFEELGSGNPGMRKIGAQRIGGTLATMTLLEGLQLYTAQFLGEALGFGGEDDEEVEDRKMRLLLPEWDAAGNIAYMFKGKLDSKQAKDKQTEGDRYFDYINFSSISGVGYAKDIIRLSFYDLDTQIGKESAMNTLKKIYAPFLGQEMTLKVMIDALGNKGGKVYNPSENGIKQAIDIVTFIGEQVKPGAVKSGLRLKESMYDLDSELVPGYEALALFGLRISRVNVNKGLGIKSNFIYKDMINTVDKSILRDRAALLKEAEENPQFDEYLNQMADLIGATRLNSVSGEDIKAILYNSRVSKPVIEEAYLRYLDRYLEDVIRVDSK